MHVIYLAFVATISSSILSLDINLRCNIIVRFTLTTKNLFLQLSRRSIQAPDRFTMVDLHVRLASQPSNISNHDPTIVFITDGCPLHSFIRILMEI